MVSDAWTKRLAPWFEDRRWRVMTERNGIVAIGGVKFTFVKGAFEIEPPGVFITPLGHRGRHGYVIIEVDGDGRDIPGTGTSFGEATLRRASQAYGTVTGLPEQES